MNKRLTYLFSPVWLAWLLISLGVFLRLVQCLSNRSLWHDEAVIALYLMNRPFAALFEPGQTAPIGFLIVEKLIGAGFDYSEFALRALPFFSGVISLPLFYVVARRCIDAKAVPIALGLFAISHHLVYFSSELKSYSTDVALALLLYWWVGDVRPERLRTGRLIVLAVIGALAVWLSHACVFVLAGIALTMVLPAMFRKEWANVGRQTLVYGVWAVSFASYFMCMHVMASRQSLVGFWSGDVPQPGAPAGGAFMPLPPTSLHDLGWFLRTFFGVFSDPGGFALTGVAALAFLAGVTSMFSRRREVIAVLLLPIGLVLVASGLERYAFSGRVILFTVPCMLLLIGQGVEVIRNRVNGRGQVIGIAVLLLLCVHPTYAAARQVLRPRTHTEMRPVLEYVEKHRRAGDMIYVNYGSRKPYRYYSRAHQCEDKALILSANAHQSWNWSGVLEDIQQLRGRDRVWVLFSGVWRFGGLDEEKFFLFHVDRAGRRIDAFKRDGAAVYLYDMSGDG